MTRWRVETMTARERDQRALKRLCRFLRKGHIMNQTGRHKFIILRQTTEDPF